MKTYEKYKRDHDDLMRIHLYFESWLFDMTEENLKELVKIIEKSYHAPSSND